MKVGKHKRLFNLFSALTAATLIAACGGPAATSPTATTGAAPTAVVSAESPTAGTTENPTATTGAADTGEAVTLTMWQKGGPDAPFIQEQINKFNAQNKDVQVQVIVQGTDDYEKALPLAFQTKQAPDVFSVTSIEPMVRENWLLPLNDHITEDLKTAYKTHMREGGNVFDGKIYGIPTSAFTVRMAYNKDLFRKAGLDPNKPPTTFSQVREAAKKITEAGNGDAFGFGLPMKWIGFSAWQVDPLVIASQPELTEFGLFNTKTGKYEMAKYEPVIQLYRDMYKDGSVFPGASSLDNDPMRSAFAEGKIGMFISASWEPGVLGTQFKTTQDWAATMIPVEDGKERLQSPSFDGGGYAVSSFTEHPKEAARVLEFLVGPQTSQILQKNGIINALHPAAASDEFFPDLKGFEYYVPGPKDTAAINPPTPLVEVQGKTYVDVLNELILTDAPIKPELEEASQRYNAAFDAGVESGKIDPKKYMQP